MGYKSGYKSYPQNTPRRKKFVRVISRSNNSAKSVARAALKDREVLLVTLPFNDTVCLIDDESNKT